MKRRTSTRSSPTRKRHRGMGGSPTPRRASDEAAAPDTGTGAAPSAAGAGAGALHAAESAPLVAPARCESEDESSLAMCDEPRVKDTWDEVRRALDRVARCFERNANARPDLTAAEYQQVYEKIATVFEQDNETGEPLKRAFYCMVHRYLRGFVDAQLAQLHGLCGMPLLNEYCRQWAVTTRVTNTLRKWTVHMHKYWVPNANNPSAIMSVDRLRLAFWKECMRRHVPYLTDHIIALINDDRKHAAYPPCHIPSVCCIRQTLETFRAIGELDVAPDHESSIPSHASEGLRFYETAFEKDFLRATAVYYQNVALSHAGLDAAKSVASIAQIFDDEERRLSRFVQERTHAPIRSELERNLVVGHKATFHDFANNLVSGPLPLDAAKVSSLRKVVSLLSRVDGGLDAVRETFRRCVVSEGRQAIVAHLPSTINVAISPFSKFLPLMAKLLQVHDRRLRMLHESFDNRNGFARALDSGFREVMNRPPMASSMQHSMAVILAHYAHHSLTARILVDIPFIPPKTQAERDGCLQIETIVATGMVPINKRLRRARMVLPLSNTARNNNGSGQQPPPPPAAHSAAGAAPRGLASHGSVTAGLTSRPIPRPAATPESSPEASRDPRIRGLRRSARLRKKTTPEVCEKDAVDEGGPHPRTRTHQDSAGLKVLLIFDTSDKTGGAPAGVLACEEPNRQRDEVIETHLHRCARLFVFLEDKDEFFEACRHLMAQRLLGEFSPRVEKKFFSKLQEYTGKSFTSKLEGMLADIKDSSSLDKEFATSVTNCECTNGVLMKHMPLIRQSRVHALKAVYWPKFVKDALKLPRPLRVVEETFERFLRSSAAGRSQRKLTWIHSHGTVLLKATVAGKTLTVDATVMQACILDRLNTRKRWTTAAMADAINAGHDEVKEHIIPMCYAGLLRLCGSELTVNDQYAGAHETLCVRKAVGLFALKAAPPSAASRRNEVIERETHLDAAIVRTMKRAKRMCLPAIVQALALVVARSPCTEEVEARLETLVEREFLSVDVAPTPVASAMDEGGGEADGDGSAQTFLYNV